MHLIPNALLCLQLTVNKVSGINALMFYLMFSKGMSHTGVCIPKKYYLEQKRLRVASL